MRVLSLLILAVFCIFSCTDDDVEKALKQSQMSADINGKAWSSETTYVQEPGNETGPMKVVGENSDYRIEIFLGNINGPGTYSFGTMRSANVQEGGSTYSTIDIPDAGSVTILKMDDYLIEGSFHFDAQWLSSNKKVKVTNGAFKAFKY